MADAIGAQSDWPNMMLLMVFNETGDGYDRANKLLSDRSANVFFLQNGVAGYKRYLDDLILSWLPRDSRIKTNKPCKICGEKSDKRVITQAPD